MTSQYPIMTKNNLKYDILISIQTLYSVLFWNTFGSDYSLKSSWVWRYKLGTPVFGEFLPFFSTDPLKLCQVGWGALLHSYFQVALEIFDWVQVWALAGPLKTIQRLVPKPLLRCLGCVLRVVILLEGEPSKPFWGLERSGAGFHQGSFCTLLRSSLPWSWLVSLSLTQKNIPTAWCRHHHASP